MGGFRQQAEDQILDRAAALFARRGFAQTSVQEVADAVGLSKAGLLHHFPSKDALHAAVLGQAAGSGSRCSTWSTTCRSAPSATCGPSRSWSTSRWPTPGLVALLLAPVSPRRPTTRATTAPRRPQRRRRAAAFGVDPAAADGRAHRPRRRRARRPRRADPRRPPGRTTTAAWRPHIVATCFDALGHRRPPVPDPGGGLIPWLVCCPDSAPSRTAAGSPSSSSGWPSWSAAASARPRWPARRPTPSPSPARSRRPRWSGSPRSSAPAAARPRRWSSRRPDGQTLTDPAERRRAGRPGRRAGGLPGRRLGQRPAGPGRADGQRRRRPRPTARSPTPAASAR